MSETLCYHFKSLSYHLQFSIVQNNYDKISSVFSILGLFGMKLEKIVQPLNRLISLIKKLRWVFNKNAFKLYSYNGNFWISISFMQFYRRLRNIRRKNMFACLIFRALRELFHHKTRSKISWTKNYLRMEQNLKAQHVFTWERRIVSPKTVHMLIWNYFYPQAICLQFFT